MKKEIQWVAKVDYYFRCPVCDMLLLEGNPEKCPHQTGPPLYRHKVKKKTVVAEIPKVPEVKTESPRTVTIEDLLNQGCAKGG